MKFDLADLGRGGNNNGNNNKKNRGNDNRDNNKQQQDKQRNKNNNNGSSYKESVKNDSFLKSTGRGAGERSFDSDDAVETTKPEENNKVAEVVEDAMETLDNFISDYSDALAEKGNQIPNIILDEFWDVAEILTHYYDKKYAPAVDKMNKTLNLCCQHRFANSLAMVCRNEQIDGWNDGKEDIWKRVMFVISILLTTSHSLMKDETISTYIDLLTSNGVAGKDIDRLVTEVGITKDLAIDLTAAIPVLAQDMTEATLSRFYTSFVTKLMQHAEENIDVMDAATQGKLFSWFFGNENTALKALGKMMSDPVLKTFGNNSQKLIYGEYQKMLAEKLDAYELGDIKYVLKYISNIKATRDGALIVFSTVELREYSSIRKALLEVIKEKPEMKNLIGE